MGYELALLAAIAVICTLTGRLHVALAGPRRLLSFGPFEAQVSAVLGTVWWMVLLTAGSSARLNVPTSVWACLLLQGAALLAVFIRRRQGALLPARRARVWLSLLAPLALTGLTGLLPVWRNGTFSTGNDSLLYCSLAQWYQDHSFVDAVFPPDQPLAHYAAIYRAAGYPLAPSFLLGGVQSLARATSPVVVYPALSTWGLVLSVGSLLVFGRRVLRWPLRWLLWVGLSLGAFLQPLAWAHHMGFLAQTFATPLLLTAMAHLAGVASSRRWKSPEALVAGMLTAGIASTYPPFLPLLVGAWAWWLVGRARRGPGDAGRVLPWAVLAVAIASTLVAAQGLNLLRALTFLGGTLVGGHVDLSPWGFVQAALGAWFWIPFRLESLIEPLRVGHLWLVPLYLWLTVRGLRLLARDPRAGPLLGCLTVLAAAFLWYGFVARDPWTAERGHSWNLFKLTQWSFAPLVLALVQGLLSLRRHAWARWLAPVLLLVPLAQAPVYWSVAGRLGAELGTFVGSSRPLDTWNEVRQHVVELPQVRLVAADTPASTTPFLPTYLGLLAYPRPVAGDWQGALWVPPNPANEVDRLWSLLAQGQALADGQAITPIVTGLRGFVTDAVLPLGGGIGLVKEPTTAQVLALLQPSDDERGPGGCVWLGGARSRLVVFSPREEKATLRLAGSSDDQGTERLRPLVVASEGESHEVEVNDPARIDLPVLLRRGAGRVEIAFPLKVAGIESQHRLCVLTLTIENGR